MGLVTQADADGAADLARYVSGVTRVVKVFEYLN
jgi:osmotically-inducible protein OsmY